MGFLRRRQAPDMPPLVEAPKGGEPIIFDEEEQLAIDKEIKYQFDTFHKDKIYPDIIAEPLSKTFAADGLRKVVNSRLHSGDFKGAASTCMKLLGISIIPHPDWLLLAKIFALYGDTVRSKGFLDNAKKTRKQHMKKYMEPELLEQATAGLMLDSLKEFNKKRGGKQHTAMELVEMSWKQEVQEVQDIIKSKDK